MGRWEEVDLSKERLSKERKGRPDRKLPAPAWLYLIGGAVLVAVVVLLVVSLVRDFRGAGGLVREIVVSPLDGGMELVLIRIREGEVDEATLYLEDGAGVESATVLPGRRDALAFFVPAGTRWIRLEVTTPAGAVSEEVER